MMKRDTRTIDPLQEHAKGLDSLRIGEDPEV